MDREMKDMLEDLPPPVSTEKLTPEGLLHEVNTVRIVQAGREVLAQSSQLAQAAQELADHVAKTGRLSHWDFAGRLRRCGYRYSAAAENAARCQTEREAVDLWLGSPGHRKNMLGNYDDAGCGVARAKGGEYVFVLTLARPARQTPGRRSAAPERSLPKPTDPRRKK